MPKYDATISIVFEADDEEAAELYLDDVIEVGYQLEDLREVVN